jgi:hypothetical protein
MHTDEGSGPARHLPIAHSAVEQHWPDAGGALHCVVSETSETGNAQTL